MCSKIEQIPWIVVNGVMVACEDAELRGNRLAMLKSMADRFARLADFAALQI